MMQHHDKIEKNSFLMLVLVIIVISIGGIVEVVPLFRTEVTIEPVEGVRPYTPLELTGYNIYIREGCYTCHSQQIRPLRDEVERYGNYSLAAESMYDHPFQWGSKRTGPDLARVGGKYSDEWQVQHLIAPRSLVPESIMPNYSHLIERSADLNDMDKHLNALQTLGVPYSDEMVETAYQDAMAQVQPDSDNADRLREHYGEKVNIRDFDDNPKLTSEMDALVAYLQVLGTMVDFTDFDTEVEMGETKNHSPLEGESKSASEAPRDSVGGESATLTDTSSNASIPPTKTSSDVLTPPQGGSEGIAQEADEFTKRSQEREPSVSEAVSSIAQHSSAEQGETQ